MLIAAIVALLLSGIMSVQAVRSAVADFFVFVYEKFSVITYHVPDYDDAENPSVPEVIESLYEPAHIPDGYAKSEERAAPLIYEVYFSDDSGREIGFSQKTMTGRIFISDTELAEYERLTVNGAQAFYVFKHGISTLFWSDYQYAFELSGPIEREQILEMAKSLGPK